MNRTTPPRNAKHSRLSAETTDPTPTNCSGNEGTGAGPVSRARGQAPALSGARLANRLPEDALIMWTSKSAPVAPDGRLAHDTGCGYT